MLDTSFLGNKFLRHPISTVVRSVGWEFNPSKLHELGEVFALWYKADNVVYYDDNYVEADLNTRVWINLHEEGHIALHHDGLHSTRTIHDELDADWYAVQHWPKGADEGEHAGIQALVSMAKFFWETNRIPDLEEIPGRLFALGGITEGAVVYELIRSAYPRG